MLPIITKINKKSNKVAFIKSVRLNLVNKTGGSQLLNFLPNLPVKKQKVKSLQEIQKVIKTSTQNV